MYLRNCTVVLADAPSGECTTLDKEMIDEMKKGMLGLGDYYSNLAGELCNCEGENCNSMKPPNIPKAVGGEGDSSGGASAAVLSASLLAFLAHMLR